ncbi:hypothetical protein M422DRAFT_259193 [Sphaerobolus stellatus SS14]|uniref:Uncharacterized protein n=1 Tax=Sphaerobolus stellatus (strain SS14) TaxID=990650 RepID=A0A0C9VKK1_SPHS4|nr:hypothetical protein M422DRAFT_259193 [Sphaerobolus stellatus SS14]
MRALVAVVVELAVVITLKTNYLRLDFDIATSKSESVPASLAQTVHTQHTDNTPHNTAGMDDLGVQSQSVSALVLASPGQQEQVRYLRSSPRLNQMLSYRSVGFTLEDFVAVPGVAAVAPEGAGRMPRAFAPFAPPSVPPFPFPLLSAAPPPLHTTVTAPHRTAPHRSPTQPNSTLKLSIPSYFATIVPAINTEG